MNTTTTLQPQPMSRPIKPGCDCLSATNRFPKLSKIVSYLESIHTRVDLPTISGLLAELDVTRGDVDDACKFGTCSYKRNTIAESPWFELLALCWRSGHCTPVHDHQGHSCAFRVITGTGTEIRYKQTPSGLLCPAASIEMPTGYVCAAEDADIHQVANMQAPGIDLVTLHIYSPPISKMNRYELPCSAGAEEASAT